MCEKYTRKICVGDKFGRWTIIESSTYRCQNNRNCYWVCRCECGVIKNVRNDLLLDGNSKSCGCLTREVNAGVQYKHGLFKNPIYRIYQGMKYRCYNKNISCYKNYGGRGIYVCDRWLESVANFYEDMGDCPEGMSLDRIDNSGPYSPENCRWATIEEQSNNRRDNHRITINGVECTVSQAARDYGMNVNTVLDRLHRGWSPERALNEPIRNRHS